MTQALHKLIGLIRKSTVLARRADVTHERKHMRILLSNDDGIAAEGLAVLEQAARRISDDVWVVAPDGNRSGFGHCISFRKSVELNQVGPQRYTCSGTPADCVISSLFWLFANDRAPDLVLSGINEGRNVAEDVAYSGTMAVAREAAFNGIASVSFSRPRYKEGYAPTDAEWIADQLAHFWHTRQQWAGDGSWLNVNLPRHLPAALHAAQLGHDKVAKGVLVHETQGLQFARLEPLGQRSYHTTEGDENALLQAGFASVTRLTWRGSHPVPAAVLNR